jgi:excisionase family DNA binding protein
MKDNRSDSYGDQPDLGELITLSEAAELSGFTTRHLRYLAVNGEIWAKKLGRNWFTTAQAVKEYLARERKPGPKSK